MAAQLADPFLSPCPASSFNVVNVVKGLFHFEKNVFHIRVVLYNDVVYVLMHACAEA